MNPTDQTVPLRAALEQIGPHEHLCSIYESQQEHFAVAIPFIIMNGIEAMSAVEDRPRALVLRTQSGEINQVRVTVQDSGSCTLVAKKKSR